jgi:hypothetical protein
MSQVQVHFCLQPYAYFPCYYSCISYIFVHLLSTNHKCTQPCYFSPATQTCCLEGEDALEFFDEEF